MRTRERVEEPFGSMKTIDSVHTLRHIDRQTNRAWFKINVAVHNLIRITALDTQTRARLNSQTRRTTGPAHEPPVRNRPHHPTLSQ
jgi:hypothetical protein